jgi:hypothetical protein
MRGLLKARVFVSSDAVGAQRAREFLWQLEDRAEQAGHVGSAVGCLLDVACCAHLLQEIGFDDLSVFPVPLRLVHNQFLVLPLQLGYPLFANRSEPGVVIILAQRASSTATCGITVQPIVTVESAIIPSISRAYINIRVVERARLVLLVFLAVITSRTCGRDPVCFERPTPLFRCS